MYQPEIEKRNKMKIRSTKGLTFDDVLLVPKRSPVTSRQDVDTLTRLTPAISSRVHCSVPILKHLILILIMTRVSVWISRCSWGILGL